VRVAVSGASGRLGRALVAALEEAPFTGLAGPIGWTRADLDLDRPEAIPALLDRDRPEVVVHAAAWTDVDGCAREPDLAMRRNGEATRILAEACVTRGLDLVVISTNEVFDGRRSDGQGYLPSDAVSPINPYGSSKLAGEEGARRAYEGLAGPQLAGPQLAIVRTAWLFGPGPPDFPRKILAAARRAQAAREPLPVVGDEWGCPTYTADLAEAVVELIGSGEVAGLHHLVNGSFATRADWARDVVARAGLSVEVQDVPSATWPRPSTPPRWGVLAQTRLPSAEPLRAWPDAMADYAPTLLQAWTAAR
jgi:dTDP-4-dehydrorhamnose reductase